MAERYRRILSIEEMYFQEESPLLLEKAALLFDQQKEINIFQGKFTNIQSSSISAVYIDIACFDISGKKLGIAQGIYLDMDIPQNASFGTNIPVEIPYLDARKFAFTIAKIAYTDGNIKELKLPIHSVAKVESLSSNETYMEQYIREINLLNPKVKCRNMLVNNKEYWICPCGTLNAINNKICRNCNLSIDKLTKLSDISYLNQRQTEYEEEMRQKKQIMQQQEEARLKDIHIRNKKLVKFFSVCAVVSVFVFLMANYFVLPQYYGSKAAEYINDGDFESAEKTYQKITSQLRKSKQLDGYYNFCIKFLGENDIENAEKCYTKIQDTEKVKDDKLNNLWKDACIKEVNNNSDNMLLCYSHIKNKNVLENKELNDTFMECGKKLLIDMDFKNATSLYLSKIAEKYSTSLENIYYESAMQLIEKGSYTEAINNCFEYISEEHLSELDNHLKNAYISSIETASSNIKNFSKIEKYLSQENVSSIKKILYSKGKDNLKVNGANTFSENCFSQLKNYRDSERYYDFIKITSSGDVPYIYKTLSKMNSKIAKKYLRENTEIRKYIESLNEIIGSWKGNKSGYDFYVTISSSKVDFKRYYDHKPYDGMVDPRAGELRDSGNYKLKYLSSLGWYYVRFNKKLTISKSQNTLNFQFYDVWKETIKMH